MKKILLLMTAFTLSAQMAWAKPFLESLTAEVQPGMSLSIGDYMGTGVSTAFGLQTTYLNYSIGSNYYVAIVPAADVKSMPDYSKIGAGNGNLAEVFLRIEYPIPLLLTKYGIRLYTGVDLGESYFFGIYKEGKYYVEKEMLGYMGNFYVSGGYSLTQQTEVMLSISFAVRAMNYELEPDVYPSMSSPAFHAGLRFHSGDLFEMKY